MKQTSRALRALSPKRRHAAHTDEESDGASPNARSGASSPTHLASLAGRAASRSRQRTRRRRSADLPELEKSDADFYREWGITREREEILLSEFRKQVEAAAGAPLKPMFDRYYLRRFLRARQHDLKRGKEMFMAHLKWRQEDQVDTVLADFEFPERDAFMALYPQGYHKADKLGRPLFIQHVGAIKVKELAEITTEDRMLRYNIQEYERCLNYILPACSKVAGRHIDQTMAIMDVKGVGLKHLTGDVKQIMGRMTSIAQNNYPEMMGKMVIINAPTVFKMIWAVVRPMLDARTQAKIEVAPTDYMKLLLRYVDEDSIPEYLGGKSKGSLIDDVGPWKDAAVVAAVEADILQRDSAGGVLSTDSADLEGSSSRGDLTPHPAPSPLSATITPTAAVAAAASSSSQHPLAGASAASAPAGAQVSRPLPGSPFDQPAAGGVLQQASPTMTSDDEFADARSRRLSILSSGGSDAYMSAAEEDSDFFTPKAGDAGAQPSGSSFQSDRPLLDPSLPASPDGKPAAVAGVAALPPHSQQQQQQQLAAAAAGRYSDQGSPRHGRRPQLAVVLPGGGSSDGGPEASWAEGSSPRAYAAPAWSAGKQQLQQQWAAGQALAVPAVPLQIPILARVRALEEKLPEAERGVRRYLPPGGELPSKACGQGTLLSRVQALERAMDTLLRAQDTALDQQRHHAAEAPSRGCSGCCAIQ